ncbi:MAG: putative Ig domain-containing protein, partial [Desulfobacterales bacterium]|nr:putative Ig domain-containing protein [Desulfobacterales bacterium]
LQEGTTINTTPATNKLGDGKLQLTPDDDDDPGTTDLSPHAAGFSNLSQGTISVWFKTDANDDHMTLISLSDSSNGSNFIRLGLMNTGQLTFEVREGGSDQFLAYGTTILNDNQWHHIAVCIDGGGNRIYVDGEQATAANGKLFYPYSETHDESTQKFFSTVPNLDAMHIGALEYSQTLGWKFEGFIDDVRIYNRGLSQGDVNELYLAANAAPEITSNGGGDTAEIKLPGNSQSVTTVTADDANGDTLTYGIDPGGADSSAFSIEADSGELSFITPPDFSNPTDANGDNTYEVIVTVNDGNGGSDSQTLLVKVKDPEMLIYPDSYGESNPYEWIKQVQFGTIDHTSGAEPDGYGDYTSQRTEITPGQTLDLSVSIQTRHENNDYYYLWAWIDWNRDGDFEDDGESYELTKGFDLSTDPHTISITAPADAAVGTIAMRITLKGGGAPPTSDEIFGGGEVEDYAIKVVAPNSPPVLTPIGDQSVNEHYALNFTATATDPNSPGDTLTYALDSTSVAAGMTIDASTGQFSWTPGELQQGNHTVTITVTDDGNGNLSDSETFTITVNETNTTPVLHFIPDQSIDEHDTLNFIATATDSDDPSNTLTFKLDATSLAAGMTIDTATGEFSWTPGELQQGDHTVTIYLTDGDFATLSVSNTFTITVNETNSEPVLAAIGNQSVNEHDALTFTATATDSDDPTNTLIYTLDPTSVAAGMTINETTGEFSWTPGELQHGNHTVTITVTDNGDGNLSDSETFTITVNETNATPVLAPIGNKSVDEHDTLNFIATATDSDDPANTLTFKLDATSLAAGMTINAATGEFSWTPGELQQGDHTAIIYVTDSDFATLSVSNAFTITVNETNSEPVLAAIGDQSVNEHDALTFTATATDSDDPTDTLAYTLDPTSVAAGMTIDETTGEFSWTPGELQQGNHTVTITVTDDGTGNLSDSETFTITVGEINTAPVLDAIG